MKVRLNSTRDRGETEEIWFGIYRLLFPGDPDPSSGPCKAIRSIMDYSRMLTLLQIAMAAVDTLLDFS